MSRSLAELDTYLVGKWEFENNFKDSTLNTNHGTPTDIEWKPTSRGIKTILDGASSKITIGDVYDGVKTISLYAQLSSTTEQLLDLNGTANIDISAGTVQANNVTSPTIYIDGIATASLSDVTGFHQITITTATGINVSALVIGLIGASYGSFRCDDLRLYSETFDSTEALALYNATKDTHGVIPAERSYTHRLSPSVDNSTVFATDMHTKDGYDLVDLSGNGNNGTVNNAVRSGGYFTDGMRFSAASSSRVLIDVADISWDSTFEFLFSTDDIGVFQRLLVVDKSIIPFTILTDSGILRIGVLDNVSDSSLTYEGVNVGDGSLHVLSVYAGGTGLKDDMVLHIDGVEITESIVTGGVTASDETFVAGRLISSTYSHYDINSMNYLRIHNAGTGTGNEVQRFNSLAVLPIFSFNAADYPANDTVYTSNIPYSSMIVTSGSFEINLDNELECITTGTLEMSNSHQFDESEYITLNIGGVKTSGTGSVTSGTITASISQGSNVITIDMDAGDKLNRLDIQFREPVAE